MASYVTNLPLNNVFNVTATFGQTGSLWKNGHKGIDLTGEKKIYSVCDGEVTFEGYDAGGWGRYVSIMPSGQSRVRFIFCHLEQNSVKVKKGDKVTRLSHIGTMGSTGNSTGVHLHIEMRIDNTPCDLSPYLLIPNKKASGLKATDYKFDAKNQNSLIESIIKSFDGADNQTHLLNKINELEERLKIAEQKIINAKNALN